MGRPSTQSLTMPFRLYAHGNDKYLADHALALYEETNEASNGMKVVLWHSDDVAENADFDYEDGQLVSCKYPSHCLAVYETGNAVDGDKVVLWARDNVAENAQWHAKSNHRVGSNAKGTDDRPMNLAVYEAPTDLGEGPNGFDICVWHAPDTGKNAKWHFKGSDPSSSDS